MPNPEPLNPTEALDVQRRMAATLDGSLAVNSASYPYFPPEYRLPFLHIGTERQLFLDNFMLDHLQDVVRTFPTPRRPDEPVLTVGDLPWEHRARSVPNTMPIAAIQDPDDGLYKLWYIQSTTGDPFSSGQILCYAESTDCLHWQKPLSDACLPYEGHTATNIVLKDIAHEAIVLNPDRSDPARKYLMLYNPQDEAKARGRRFLSRVAASPDGLRWTVISPESDRPHHHTPRVIWDDAIRRWVAYSQYSHHWNFLYRKRQIGRQESEDFIHWSPKKVVLSGDWDPNLPPDLEYHDLSVRKVGGLYIGIVTQFMAEPLWNVRNGSNWRDVAHMQLALCVSRDGRRWQRVGGPEPWVDNRGPGSIDYGLLNFSAPGQLYHAGRTYILYDAMADKQHWYGPYYRPPTPIVPADRYAAEAAAWDTLGQTLGRYPLHTRSIGLLELREDGWAALQPSYERGEVITRQFVFAGDALRVNAECYGGFLRVELLDPEFKPYPGFSAAECDPICADTPHTAWHPVTWHGHGDVRSLWDKPCRLRFYLQQVSLYGFQFFDSAPQSRAAS